MTPRRRRLVYDLMSTDLITVTPDVDLSDAYGLMLRNDVRRLPVVDEDGELVGIITRSDVQQMIPRTGYEADRYEAELSLIGQTVQDAMTWDPVIVTPEDTIQEAAERMIEFQVSGLPVVNGRDLVGIVTESDIFRYVVDSWSREDDEPD